MHSKLFFIIVLLLVFLSGCGGSSTPAPPGPTPSRIAHIELVPSAVLLTKSGETHALVARAYDAEDKPIEASFTWTSSNTEDVSIDQNGLLSSLTNTGSAQITVEAEGVRSSPAQVLVAEPAAGAVLVSDAQVVGGPELLDPSELPTVGTHYRVTLQDVSAPPAGSILLARESAPLAGRVVSATVSGKLVEVVLELVPLDDLFIKHDIDFQFDLDLYDLAMVDDPFSTSTVIRNPDGSVNLRYHYDRGLAPQAEEKVGKEFKKGPLECSAEVAAYLKSTVVDVKLAGTPTLHYQDSGDDAAESRYVKLVLSGELSLTVSGGVQVEAGFTGKGECKLVARIRVPLGGPLSVFVAPAIPVGIGFTADGKFIVASGEAGLKGKVGANMDLGFECGPGDTPCRSIDTFQPINELEPVLRVPSEKDMRVEAGLSFYLLSGLDMAILAVKNYSIFEAKVGPRQDVNLSFVDAQASDKAYASNYDLKLRGEVGLGSDVQKWFEAVVKGKAAANLTLTVDKPLSSSPVGSLSVDKSQVAVGDTVQFTVDLDPSSLNYFLLGYNITEVRIYRLKDGVAELMQAIPVAASNQSSFLWDWTAKKEFEGNNEFVAFVVTKGLPGVPLEVKTDSTVRVNVGEGAWRGTVTLTDTYTRAYTDERDSICCGGKPQHYKTTLEQAEVITATWTLTGEAAGAYDNYPSTFVMNASHNEVFEKTWNGYNRCREGAYPETTHEIRRTETGEVSLSDAVAVKITFARDGAYTILGNAPETRPTGTVTWTRDERHGPDCNGEYREVHETGSYDYNLGDYPGYGHGTVDPEKPNELSGSEVVWDRRYEDSGIASKRVVSWSLTR